MVKVLPVDEQGRLNFSRREALIEVEGLVPENDITERAPRKPGGRRNFHKGDRK
jgi:polyribonucleotide nucleotidyltransferase